MGKEAICVMRPVSKKVLPVYNFQSADIQQEATNKWDLCETMSQCSIVEDGGVLITVVSQSMEDRFLCTGFTQTGNKFSNLTSALKKKGLISSNGKVKTVLLDKGYVNLKVNVKRDVFSIGDRIILVVEERIKRPIKKISKAKKEYKKRN